MIQMEFFFKQMKMSKAHFSRVDLFSDIISVSVIATSKYS